MLVQPVAQQQESSRAVGINAAALAERDEIEHSNGGG